MNKWLFAFLFAALIGLGGCQMDTGNGAQKPAEMDPEDLPDVRAFQDEFTREFLQSTEETRDGYYPFLSGTGRYGMDFPAGGIIGEKSYAEKEKGYEGLLLGVYEENGFESSININYYSHHKLGEENDTLDLLESRLDMELEFHEKEDDHKYIYYSYFEYEDDESFGVAANVVNKLGTGAIQIVYTTGCETNEGYSTGKDEMKQKMDIWFNSIKFINNEGE